jgi:hypothetical protein
MGGQWSKFIVWRVVGGRDIGATIALQIGNEPIGEACGHALRPWTLEFSLILNVGIVHQGTPLPDFPIFALLYFFFGNFFSKIGIHDLDLAQEAYFGHSLNGKGEFEIRGGPPIKQ